MVLKKKSGKVWLPRGKMPPPTRHIPNKRKNQVVYCDDCGCRMYEYGCVNCNEQDYIDAQDWERT
mgnify:CR=1 FL=1